jgi:hypothetical protein
LPFCIALVNSAPSAGMMLFACLLCLFCFNLHFNTDSLDVPSHFSHTRASARCFSWAPWSN